MKIFFYIGMLVLGLEANAQSKTERIVLSNAEKLQATVFGSKDSATLEKLFASTLHYQHSGGKVETREQALHNIIHNKSTYVESIAKPSPYRVLAEGDSIVVTHNYVAVEKKADGKEASLDLSIRTVWMKENGRWKLFRRVATKNKHD